MRKLIRLILLLIVVIVAGVIAALFYIDSIARQAVERGGTYALGVNTTLKTADVKVFSGEVTINGLRVANPEGYAADQFLRLGAGDMEVSLASLRQDVVRLPLLKLAGVDVNLEKKDGKANYQVILDNLRKLSKGEKPAEGGKKYVIDVVDLRRVTVHVNALGQNLDVPLDRIRLKNVGSAGGGLPMGQLAGVIVRAIFEAVVKKAGDVGLPGDVLNDLASGIKDLADLDRLAEIADIESAKSAVEDLTNKAKEGLGGILGGKKEEEDQPE